MLFDLFQIITNSIFQIFLLLFHPVALIPIVIAVIVFIKKYREYKKGAYYQITKFPYISLRSNYGRYGEYLTYKHLKSFENNGARFLFNVYIPKEDGTTTEIDVLMICSKGIFVFESKNYSGWIFGSEGQKNWYQTLPKGRGRSHKESFYNPIMQNRSHIKHLKGFIGEQIPMHSVIVFSERCTLKSVKINNSDVRVINRQDVFNVVSRVCSLISDDLLTKNEIDELYNKLYPYTQIDDTARAEHISNIHNKLNSEANLKNVSPIITTETESADKTVESIDTVTDSTKQESISSLQSDSNEITLETISTKPLDNSKGESDESDSEEAKTLKCPKCNGDLVLRTAKRGANIGDKFYGCANYPKCKYIKTLN